MSKRLIFKTLIADSISRDFSHAQKRQLEIPMNVEKVITFIGPRRAGKTSVMYHTIQELRSTIPSDRLVYINFEDNRLFPLQPSDMDELAQGYYELYPENKHETVYFFLDEIQEVPNWEKFVRRISDQENCRLFLTGSSSKLLSSEIASSLRGRTLVYEVLPLSYSEFLDFNKVKFNPDTSEGKAIAIHWFEKWMTQGGFPELIFIEERLHRSIINEYIDVMLYKDLTQRFGIKQPALMKYLLKYFLQNISKPITVQKVFHDLKSQGYAIGKNIVHEYLSHLIDAFVLFRADIWSSSKRKQAVNPSKYYCIDPAFKSAVSIQKDEGRVFENGVYLHLRRNGIEPLYVMQNQEVDFYWQGGSLINVCLDMREAITRNRELSGMQEAMEKLQLQSGTIITKDEEQTISTSTGIISLLPAWKYFLTPQS
jgi:predicted AAA+ superfamily ATPase